MCAARTLLLCAVLLTGCASHATRDAAPPLDDPPVHAWLDARAQALAGGAPITLELLDDAGLAAELFADGRLRIHRGLLLRTRDEAEITFVLAHELAHGELGHFAQRARGTDWDPLQAEFAADRHALQALTQMGLRADAGTGLLSAIDAELALLPDADGPARALLAQRLDALWEFTPPGHPVHGVDGWRGLLDSRWEAWFAADPAATDEARAALLREHAQRPLP